ncbi:MAG: hypothetical protein F4X57_11580 [Chloroflexi bacterium]|nr:hypothetical protein [Chloroflexota bacterium]
MGALNLTIEVSGRQGEQFEEVDALVDASAVTTMLPGSMLRRLGVIPTTSEIFAHACGEGGAAPLLRAYKLEGLRLGPIRTATHPVGQTAVIAMKS